MILATDPIDEEEFKARIIESARNRRNPELLSAIYFNSEINDDVRVTYDIPQIFGLVWF